MLSRATIFSSFFYLAIIAATRFAFASPAIKPSIDQTSQEASLEDRWSAIHQHVGNSGMDVLCQAFLPLATATKTGESDLLCCPQRSPDPRFVSSQCHLCYPLDNDNNGLYHCC
jgi:hypothetical protein